MIWFDNLNAYGSANYYVQKLFSLNPGTNLLAIQISGVPNLDDKKKALSFSSTLDKKTGEVIIKAVNVTNEVLEADIELQGAIKAGPQAKEILLTAKNLNDVNSLQEPQKIFPVEKTITVSGPEFSCKFQPYSFTILRIPAE